MKNIVLKKVVKQLQKWIPRHKTIHQILVVSTRGLSDHLWATAAIENIRRSYPDCYLGVLTTSLGEEVFKHNLHIHRVFVMKEPLSHHILSLWKKLYFEKFDTVLFFDGPQRLTLPLCALIGASRIIGTAGINQGLDPLFTEALPNREQHEIVRRLKIVEAIGVFPEVETLSFFLKREEHLPPRKTGRWIAMHPGSKESFKRWPAEKFIALGKQLKEKLDCEILVTGSQKERDLMEKVALGIPGAEIDVPNRSVREFGALLCQMDLLISNDTGAVQLASALSRPVIALYASTDPAISGPYKNSEGFVIHKRAPCDPCLKKKCRQPFCFLQISPEEVFQQIKKIFFLLFVACLSSCVAEPSPICLRPCCQKHAANKPCKQECPCESSHKCKQGTPIPNRY